MIVTNELLLLKDVDDLRRQLAEAEEARRVAEVVSERMTEHVGRYIEQADAVEAKLALAEQDAMRLWEYLQGRNDKGREKILACEFRVLENDDPTKEEWREAIDAAIAAGEVKDD